MAPVPGRHWRTPSTRPFGPPPPRRGEVPGHVVERGGHPRVEGIEERRGEDRLQVSPGGAGSLPARRQPGDAGAVRRGEDGPQVAVGLAVHLRRLARPPQPPRRLRGGAQAAEVPEVVPDDAVLPLPEELPIRDGGRQEAGPDRRVAGRPRPPDPLHRAAEGGVDALEPAVVARDEPVLDERPDGVAVRVELPLLAHELPALLLMGREVLQRAPRLLQVPGVGERDGLVGPVAQVELVVEPLAGVRLAEVEADELVGDRGEVGVEDRRLREREARAAGEERPPAGSRLLVESAGIDRPGGPGRRRRVDRPEGESQDDLRGPPGREGEVEDQPRSLGRGARAGRREERRRLASPERHCGPAAARRRPELERCRRPPLEAQTRPGRSIPPVRERDLEEREELSVRGPGGRLSGEGRRKGGDRDLDAGGRGGVPEDEALPHQREPALLERLPEAGRQAAQLAPGERLHGDAAAEEDLEPRRDPGAVEEVGEAGHRPGVREVLVGGRLEVLDRRPGRGRHCHGEGERDGGQRGRPPAREAGMRSMHGGSSFGARRCAAPTRRYGTAAAGGGEQGGPRSARRPARIGEPGREAPGGTAGGARPGRPGRARTSPRSEEATASGPRRSSAGRGAGERAAGPERRRSAPAVLRMFPDLHLMLQPRLGFWSTITGRPASTALSAALRSFPVTGVSVFGRDPSNCPR